MGGGDEGIGGGGGLGGCGDGGGDFGGAGGGGVLAPAIRGPVLGCAYTGPEYGSPSVMRDVDGPKMDVICCETIFISGESTPPSISWNTIVGVPGIAISPTMTFDTPAYTLVVSFEMYGRLEVASATSATVAVTVTTAVGTDAAGVTTTDGPSATATET